MALIRTLLRGRSRLHLFGIESYGSASGGDELFALIESQKPRVVLMQSFAAGDTAIRTGGIIPYRSQFNPAGLERAMAMVSEPSFRASWSSEAVAVLAALRVGAEVRFVDRLHALSFDRLVARMSADTMRVQVALATEGVAKAFEQRPPGTDALPQDAMCPFFPELWGDRHTVMAHVTQQVLAESEPSDVALVIGADHLKPVKAKIEDDLVDIGKLLDPAESVAGESWEDELEKRAALAALLATTRSFPVNHVLPDSENLLPRALEIVKRFYPKYRSGIGERLAALNKPVTQESMTAQLSNENPVHGIAALEALCMQLAPNELPPTPPPPPRSGSAAL